MRYEESATTLTRDNLVSRLYSYQNFISVKAGIANSFVKCLQANAPLISYFSCNFIFKTSVGKALHDLNFKRNVAAETSRKRKDKDKVFGAILSLGETAFFLYINL